MAGVPVRIGIVFEPNKKAKPIWFELNRQKYFVKETTYFWKDKVGDTHLLHFAVTSDGALFELVFNLSEQSWTLLQKKVIE